MSHRSAALLHRLPLLGRPPQSPQLTVSPRRTGDVDVGHLYRATLRPADIATVDGVPVTSVARTLTDLARTMWVPASVSAIDYALHNRMVTHDELLDSASACKGWPGSRSIAPTIALADARAESPLESCSRLTFADVGVPTPDLQASIYRLGAEFLGRADFYWDEYGVVGEADGRAKYTDRGVLVEEKLRQERLEDAGLIVVRWTWTDIRYETASLKRRLERAFARGRGTASPREWSVVRLERRD